MQWSLELARPKLSDHMIRLVQLSPRPRVMKIDVYGDVLSAYLSLATAQDSFFGPSRSALPAPIL
jgi:hypothetical protein